MLYIRSRVPLAIPLFLSFFICNPLFADSWSYSASEFSVEQAPNYCESLPCTISFAGEDFDLQGESSRTHATEVSFEATLSQNGLPYGSAALAVSLTAAGEISVIGARTFYTSSGSRTETFSAVFTDANHILFQSGFLPDISVPDISLLTVAIVLEGTPFTPLVEPAPMCVDRVREGLKCEGPVMAIGPIALPNGPAAERCCREHDQCYSTSHTQTERLGCDLVLLGCTNAGAGILAPLNAPYSILVTTFIAAGGTFAFSPENAECWCYWEIPEWVHNSLDKMIQRDMTIKASQCCNDENECEVGKECTVAIVGVIEGTNIETELEWKGKCEGAEQ